MTGGGQAAGEGYIETGGDHVGNAVRYPGVGPQASGRRQNVTRAGRGRGQGTGGGVSGRSVDEGRSPTLERDMKIWFGKMLAWQAGILIAAMAGIKVFGH